jgi:hypothetical protein
VHVASLGFSTFASEYKGKRALFSIVVVDGDGDGDGSLCLFSPRPFPFFSSRLIPGAAGGRSLARVRDGREEPSPIGDVDLRPLRPLLRPLVICRSRSWGIGLRARGTGRPIEDQAPAQRAHLFEVRIETTTAQYDEADRAGDKQ